MSLRAVGGICVLVALVGGGLGLFGLTFPTLDVRRCVALALLGALFVALDLWVLRRRSLAAGQPQRSLLEFRWGSFELRRSREDIVQSQGDEATSEPDAASRR